MVVDRADADRTDLVFHALSDATRRDIVALALHGEYSVSDLARRYPMSFAAVQKHVALLERAGLITYRPLRQDATGVTLVLRQRRHGQHVPLAVRDLIATFVAHAAGTTSAEAPSESA